MYSETLDLPHGELIWNFVVKLIILEEDILWLNDSPIESWHAIVGAGPVCGGSDWSYPNERPTNFRTSARRERRSGIQ